NFRLSMTHLQLHQNTLTRCLRNRVDDEDIRTQVYSFLDKAHEPNGNRLKPRQKHVNEVIDGLKAGTNPGSADAPFWIGREGPEPRGLLVCRNGLLELESGRLWE